MESVILLTLVLALVAAAAGGAAGYFMRQARQRTSHDPIRFAAEATARLDAETETRVKEIMLQHGLVPA